METFSLETDQIKQHTRKTNVVHARSLFCFDLYRRGISQLEIAIIVQHSQSTVSRAIYRAAKQPKL